MTNPDQPALRHLEQLTAQLLDGVILIDPAGTILSANAAALRMHGVGTLAELGTTAEGYAERFTLRTHDHRPLKHREYPLFRLLAGDSFPDLIVEVAPAGDDQARWIHQVRDVVMDIDGGEAEYLALVIDDVSARFDAEARFAAMFNANPAPAIVVRLHDQRIVQVNAGFETLTGFTPEALTGKSLFGLDLLANLADPVAVRRRIEEGEIVAQAEAELRVADGSRRLVLFAGQPIDVTGEDSLLLTFADLEPRRRAEQALAASEHHLRSVFEMAPVAMVVTADCDHRIASVNAAFRALTGHDARQAIGQTADDLQLWEDPQLGQSLERQLVELGAVRDAEAILRSRTGAPIDCLISAETISVEGAPCVLWVCQDVTSRKQSERELADAIDAVMKDANWLSHSILDKLATLRRPEAPAPPSNLSPREREILELICDDLDDNAIAVQLGLSRNTVRNHVARLYAKIGVNRRSGAVVWGRERGMGTRRD
ncbi:helix-turn-helix transcriptional regulator [Sphingomonas qomolangmaensis]|uniref:Helix-turn-helix transcriptional regulator n=1 Tax=Sphingomonas qomolangmaensis TaxID=2918765 RepID=A0ABY5L8G6_9SPHN|nr:helix-turn-helix transcriptional regulator [Sphingomonas qomolangmaensis]UUL83274.1 helix-turn-helix transcriptional regulator [Sphingomonas qomolangmaensis]